MGMLTDIHMYNQWILVYFIENKWKQSNGNSLNFLHLWPSLLDIEQTKCPCFYLSPFHLDLILFLK